MKSEVNDSLSSLTSSLTGYRDGPFASVMGGCVNLSWLERQAIYRIPEDAFKKGYSWYAEPHQIALLEKLERKHKVKSKKKEALSLSRLYGESYIYYDVASGNPSQELRLDSVNIGSLRFINVIRRDMVTMGQIINDPISPYYGHPEYYGLTSNSGQAVRIHPSRIARFVCHKNPVDGMGTSILNTVQKTICAADTTRDNVVALTTQARVWVLSMDGLMSMVEDPDEEAQVHRRYKLFQEMLATNSVAALDKEHEALQQQTATFATLPDIIESMRREVAASLEIPYALLFGRSGGLGSNGDMELRDYYDNVSVIQSNDIDSPCEILDEVIVRSALGSAPEEVYHMWSPLWEESAKEKADIALVYANAVKVAIESGAMVPDMLTESLVNQWVEVGAFPGLEQSYNDWVAGGGVLVEPDDDQDILRAPDELNTGDE